MNATSPYFIGPMSDSQPRTNPWPRPTWVVSGYTFSPINGDRWLPLPNPSAGLKESEWLKAHQAEVATDVQRPWVAILGEGVWAREATATLLYDRIKQDNVADALIAYVAPRPSGRPRRIA